MLKKIFKKVHDIREDFEDFFADRILKKLDEFEGLDKLERMGAKALISYIEKQYSGGKTLPEDTKNKISDSFVSCMGEANRALQRQLKRR